MTGKGESRVCDHCDTVVYDLDAMGSDRANRLLASTSARLCVRKQLTKSLQRPRLVTRRAALHAISGALLATGLGCTSVRHSSSGEIPLSQVLRDLPHGVVSFEKAMELLRTAGWTEEEIWAEALAHRSQVAEPDFTPPPSNSDEAKLGALLSVIEKEIGQQERKMRLLNVEDDNVWVDGVFIGKR